MKAIELKLGDRVRPKNPFMRCFNDMVVKQIHNEEVTFFRPYVHTADFSYTGGVICLIGIEEFGCSIHSTEDYELLDSVNLRWFMPNRNKVTIGVYCDGMHELTRLAEELGVVEYHYSYEFNRVSFVFRDIKTANTFFDRYIQRFGHD